jgi:hypothetical protein
MKKIFKFIIAVDVFLLVIVAFIVFLGCYLNSAERSRVKVEEGQRVVFRLYNADDMLFASAHDAASKSSINLPNVKIVIVDIPAGASNMAGILSLHHSVALGFLPGVGVDVVNRALYNGHQTFFKFTARAGAEGKGAFLDLKRPEAENIERINKVLASGDYDGIYMSLSDAKLMDRHPALAQKVRDVLSMVVVDETICYKNKVCYVAQGAGRELAATVVKQAASMSEADGQWTVVFSYNSELDKLIPDLTASIVDHNSRN